MTSLSSQEKASAYLSATKGNAFRQFRLLKCLSYLQDSLTAGRQCAASSSAFGIVAIQLKLLNGGVTQSNKADKRSQCNAVTAFYIIIFKPSSLRTTLSKTTLFLCPAPSTLPFNKRSVCFAYALSPSLFVWEGVAPPETSFSV